MKKIIALVLTLVMICCFSVTAFAADSPTATEKVTVTVRKADFVEGDSKVDVEYTVDSGSTITLKANEKYGKFDNWVIYVDAGKALAAGTDYEIIKGSLTSSEVTIKLNKAVIICANYDNVKTDPTAVSNADGSASAPQTSDMTVIYAVIAMFSLVAFGFGVKKVYSK